MQGTALPALWWGWRIALLGVVCVCVYVCVVCMCVCVCMCVPPQARSPRLALALAQTGLHGLRTLSSGSLGIESMFVGELGSATGAGAGAGTGAGAGMESAASDVEMGAVDSEDVSPSDAGSPDDTRAWAVLKGQRLVACSRCRDYL